MERIFCIRSEKVGNFYDVDYFINNSVISGKLHEKFICFKVKIGDVIKISIRKTGKFNTTKMKITNSTRDRLYNLNKKLSEVSKDEVLDELQ